MNDFLVDIIDFRTAFFRTNIIKYVPKNFLNILIIYILK